MGVHGLWELLAPVGRRVSVETLAGKKLAIDASIWMVQFMKAMRDEKGEMVHNAHLLGFFRRICKLLFLRTKPIFVFDGATPALKRRTLASRRRHRDAARAKIRKTAEKLLISHLKARKLEELAAELKKSSQKKEDAKGKKVESASTVDHAELDELLAASLAAEEEMGMPGADKAGGASSSAALDEEMEDDEEEEMILPLTGDNIDPAVLASLPPSMQLDLLVQMRERMMAENRQKYQKIKKSPANFSKLQIQSYLKTVAFRREIDEVQRCAAGKGLGGVQTSKVASETNREFIFSSSFTGDKEMLAKQIGSNGNADSNMGKKYTPSNLSILNGATTSKSATEAPINELEGNFGSEIETYKDERGRIRVSRLRGLGIRMTSDIQRNLDFIKEYEQVSNTGEDSPVIKDGPLVEENVHATDAADISVSANEAIEISFLEDAEEGKDSVDDIFLHLAAGVPSNKEAVDPDDSEGIWEDGTLEENDTIGKEGGDKKEKNVVWIENSVEGDDVDWEDGYSEMHVADRELELAKVSKGVLEEEALLQEAIRRSLEDSVVREIGVKKDDNKIGSSMSEEKDSDEEEVDWEEGTNTAINPSEGLDAMMKEATNISFEDLGSYKSSFEMPESTDTMKLGQSSGTLDFDAGIPLERKGGTYSEQINNKENLMEGTSNVSDVSVNRKLLEINIEKLQGRSEDSRPDEGSPEIAKQQTDATGNNKSSVSSSDVDSTRRAYDFDRGSDPNQFDSSSRGPVASSDLGIIPERGVQEFNRKSASNQSFMGLNDGNDVANESTGINLISGMNMGCDLGVSNSTKMDTVDENIMDDLNTMSDANLQEEISLLRQEQADLGQQKRKLESHAEAVSSEMFVECQELLQMFGLPYIIAPTEAEAQCAFMEINNLVDGVVTDDSDVFLFGARNVYKNIFDDRKYVETYFMKDIESELGLNREKLIRMAMLLGSDYTEGISGIGIVNAIEVVHAFPEEDGLKKFREWVESPDPSILNNIDLGLKKKSSKAEAKDGDREGLNDGKSPTTNNEDIKETFMDKHRNISKNWHMPSSFPSQAVVEAYYSPQVDNSTETFSWGKPDLNLLRKLCWERLGWDKQKADELLLPVLKEYSKHETQLRLDAFYTFNERFAKIRSQRIKKAIKGITGSAFLESDEPLQESTPGKGESSQQRRTKKKSSSIGQKGKARKRKSAQVQQEKSHPVTSAEECSDIDEPQNGATPEMTELRRSKRQRSQVKYTEDDIEAIEPDILKTNQSVATDVNEGAADENPSYADIDLTGSVQIEDTEAVVSPTEAAHKEYLYSGGGFCTEEGGENVDPETDVPVEPESETQCVSSSPNTDTKKDMINTSSTVTDANPGIPIGERVNWGLTPMRSLKRRKS